MSEHYATLCETLTRITTAPNASVVWSALKDLAGRFGYTYLMVAEAPVRGDGLQSSVLYGDAKKQNLAEFDRNLLYTEHPFVVQSLKTHAPFTVGELSRMPEFANRKWLEHIPSCVLQGQGLVVPIFKDDDLQAGCIFGGERGEVTALVKSSLQVAAHAAFERVSLLKDSHAPMGTPVLSARETQCLSYIATGHEDDQISKMLGISPRTVRFHVDSAKTKLGVSSRVQAVTKALRERIITV